jgi:DNA gyrase subunit A
MFSVVQPPDDRMSLIFVFENGKAARVNVSAYSTKTNRRKLANAYSDKSPLRAILCFVEERDAVVYSSEGRALLFNTAQLSEKSTRDSQGVQVMTLKPKYRVTGAAFLENTPIRNHARYRIRNLPAAGALLKPEDSGETQLSLDL